MTATLDAERTELISMLAEARAALTGAVEGLSDEQLAQQPTVSSLCLGGLVKHVAAMEKSWMRFVVEGLPADLFALPDGVTWADVEAGVAHEVPQWAIDHAADFRMNPGDTLAGILEHYEQIAADTEKIVAGLTDLSVTRPLPDAPWNAPGEVRSLRWALMHIVAETFQHAGHADILREAIDGRTAT
ncbi:DinB family protein [Amycolatopsis suaedae]|uniref:DinB family protein n=2 Tax=Amycolatopsis suaedae TaxID=2510978 RepID=A0A4Q7JAU7_9PSEU|nr:DinB family protein [Amycolatopsis suaedae]